MRKAKAGLTAFSPRQRFTRATYAWPSSAHSVVNLGWRILSFPIRLYANGKEMQKATCCRNKELPEPKFLGASIKVPVRADTDDDGERTGGACLPTIVDPQAGALCMQCHASGRLLILYVGCFDPLPCWDCEGKFLGTAPCTSTPAY